MQSVKSIPNWVKYTGAVLLILLAIYITYIIYLQLLKPDLSLHNKEGFQLVPVQDATIRKWTSTVVLNGSASLTSYGLNIAGTDYVIYTIPANAVLFAIVNVQTYNNTQGAPLLESILSHKNMKYILDFGIAMVPTDPAQIKYIPQIIENKYHTLTMFNEQKTNMRYVAIKPYYLSIDNVSYYYMSYIPYYLTSSQNTTLETPFTAKMSADDTARQAGNITAEPTSFITSIQLPITGKVNASDTTTVPIRPLFFRSDFLLRDTNTGNYKKLIDDNNTAGTDHSINYSNISLNIFPSLTFNSIYNKYVDNPAYTNWEFGPEMTKYLSVSFRTEAMSGITIYPALLCSYLYILEGSTKKYLAINESNRVPTKKYGLVTLTTDIKLATKFNVDLGSNTNKCIRYSIPAVPNNLSKSYVLGVLYINPLPADTKNKLIFSEVDATNTPVQLETAELTIFKNNAQIHNDRLPWYLFENIGDADNKSSFVYGSGAYNTYLTVSGTSLLVKSGSSRRPTPAPVVIYNSPAQLDIQYKYADTLVGNLYKIPNGNEYVYLDTSPINSVTNQPYSRLVLYMPQLSFPQANHSILNGVLTIQNRGNNLQLSSPDFYNYNITVNSSNITLNNYTSSVRACPQTVNIVGASLPKYVPPIETLLSSYTQSSDTWQIKSPAYPTVNNALVTKYENKNNPSIHLFRLQTTGEYVAYIYNPVDAGVALVSNNIDINAQNTELAFPRKFIYYKNLVRFVYNASTKTYTINELPKTDRVLFNVNMTVEPYVPPTTTSTPVLEKPLTTNKPVIPPAETTTTTQYITPVEPDATTTQYIKPAVEPTTTQYIPSEDEPPVETTQYIPSEEEPPVATEYYKPGSAGMASTV